MSIPLLMRYKALFTKYRRNPRLCILFFGEIIIFPDKSKFFFINTCIFIKNTFFYTQQINLKIVTQIIGINLIVN